ncbi:YceI family protein [Pedobacter sp. UC225_61]|uniref:YceI family protein n=1 Tax=Pedobacter sp. UC225_61 TaxID=3374623 RepID=UPI0037A86CD4
MNYKPTTINLLLITSLLFACGRPVKDEKKDSNTESVNPVTLHVGDEKYWSVDTKESVVGWKGAMQIGANAHTGYVYISKGELKLENDKLVGGTVEVDMNTIEDHNHGKSNGLINHLKNPDFFDVKNFPTATITITDVAPINEETIKITANLSIKGITRSVTFAVNLKVKNGIANANGKLIIDRTE